MAQLVIHEPPVGPSPGADVQFVPWRCVWEDPIIYCSGYSHKVGAPDNYKSDYIAAYHTVTGDVHRSERMASFAAYDSMRDASQFGVIELVSGEVRYFEYSGADFSTLPIFGGNQGKDANPVTSNQWVVYQRLDSNDEYWLDVYDIFGGTLSQSHYVGLAEPRPSQLNVRTVSYETDTSVAIAFVGPLWDPVGLLFDPVLQGCTAFRELKHGESELFLVRGEGCPEVSTGESVLYAMRPLLNGGYEAYFVGQLSNDFPAYDAYNDEIVYVNEQGQIVWVRAQSATNVSRVEEVEPNDSLADATPLPIGIHGRYSFTPLDESEFWRVDLVAGKSYAIRTMNHNEACGEPMYGTFVAVYDPAGVMLDSNDSNPVLLAGQWVTNDCGIMDNFVASFTGPHYVEVVGQGETQVPYYVVVEAL